MNLKQYTRYQIDFDSKWIDTCSALMGLSFFLRIVYYFGLVSLRDVNIIELITSVIVGILLCGGFVVCLKCLRLNAPGLYGLIGAAECLMMIVLCFSNDSVLWIIIGIIWYLLTGIILLMTVGGYLPGRLLSFLMFLIPVFVRFFISFGKHGLIRMTQEFAVMLTLIALGCLVMGLKAVSQKK